MELTEWLLFVFVVLFLVVGLMFCSLGDRARTLEQIIGDQDRVAEEREKKLLELKQRLSSTTKA
jgi:hypothetical protein